MRSNNNRAMLLREIVDLPEQALLTSTQAAAYLNTSPGVLANWRSARCGPRYCGANAFVRYRLKDLENWISQRAGEIRTSIAADECIQRYRTPVQQGGGEP
jgi:hypothetical protein